MSKARTLANLISDNAELADGQISVAEVVGAAPLASPSFTGNITVSGNVDGRDIAADGNKLDGVEASADVTDATNVTAAGALMDSELTNIAAIKALNQGVATTDEVAFDNTTLNAIAKDISDTAVDVFVYDTSKDSDGGAWRKRTQNTSWYNETLNTATRGSRKEFPAVAVIVAESDTVTIYDGDDPDMPMWMVFNKGTGNPLYSDVTSVSALNGHIVVGQNTGNGGVTEIKFINDRAYLRINDAHEYNGEIIADRNDGGGVTISTRNIMNAIVNRAVNDVAITVLPNAPIDYATGLPVSTIAAATDNGVSVIRDDGTVVDINNSSTNDYSYAVSLTGEKLSMQMGGAGPATAWVYVFNTIPLSDTVITNNSKSGTPISADAYYAKSGLGNDLYLIGDPDLGRVGNAIGCDTGLVALSEDPVTPTKGMVAYTTSTYNTGWMNGDIKLATLSDTDDTDAVGTEVVTNGDFSVNDTSPYTSFGSGTATINSGQLEVTTSTSTFEGVTRRFDNLIPFAPYRIKCTLVSGIGRFGPSVYHTQQGGVGEPFYNVSKTGSHVFEGFATANSFGRIDIRWRTQNASTTTYWDDFSIVAAEADRSVNGNGLAVNGTITKSAVATGADLMGYSGFSTSNYLEQPYNSDLDFGTGDFCIMGWFNFHNAYITPLSRGHNTEGSWYLWNHAAGVLRFYTHNGTSYGYGTQAGGVKYNEYTFLVIKREGGVLTIQQNGVQLSSFSLPTTFTCPDASLRVGTNGDLSQGSGNTKIALLRISATVPTAEQFAKIYRDEKVLFQENTQATLYGTSDAVTALAHDDTTDLLHVGTSAGRSVFQGLRRVDNTTTAVGTAISASNGLVAED
jgi:hypothetical protein